MSKIAIIGMGCAGYHGLRALRENGYDGEIHVFSDVSHPPANPMLTTYYVDGRIDHDVMFPFGSLAQLEKDYRVILHMDMSVRHVNTADKRVVFEDGSSQCFDRILVATGARAISPALGQGGRARRYLMRTVQDAETLRDMLDSGKVSSAVVVGASMVGIKVVELLQNRGVSVVLADLAPQLFSLVCMPQIAEEIRGNLEDQGIKLLLGAGVEKAEEYEHGIFTYLTDGRVLESDILVLCIGTRANTELLANTQVLEQEPIKINRGIVVDEHMQTSCPGIYAAGDCCEGLNLQTGETSIIGLWANAAAQGRCAGINMAGGSAEYLGSVPHNITHFFDLDFIGLGDPRLPGEHHVFRTEQGTYSVVAAEGNLQCVNILGNYRIGGVVKRILMDQFADEGHVLSEADRGLLRANGVPDEFIARLEGRV